MIEYSNEAILSIFYMIIMQYTVFTIGSFESIPYEGDGHEVG